MGTRASKFQSSEELSGKTQIKFHHQFHFTGTVSVFHRLLQNLFSTFGVVRNDFF